MELSGKQRRFLRALGHHLKPEIQIGKHGVTPALIEQLEHCLLAHELVKVKVLEASPIGREEAGRALAGATGGGLAQTLGRTLLLYRPHPEEPKIELPT
jgi:RNA-binding protein